jgi:hypothetical protein
MGRAEIDPSLAGSRVVTYTDAEGRATDDPASAVRGEAVVYDDHGIPRRRTRFFLTERGLPGLKMGEATFLIWVLVVLMLVWLAVGLVLYVT